MYFGRDVGGFAFSVEGIGRGQRDVCRCVTSGDGHRFGVGMSGRGGVAVAIAPPCEELERHFSESDVALPGIDEIACRDGGDDEITKLAGSCRWKVGA